jgi:hypothetical protein
MAQPLQMTSVRTASADIHLYSGPIRGGALVLAICGTLGRYSQFSQLVDLLPEADVAIVELPGVTWPFAGEVSVQGYAAVFRGLLEARDASRPVTLVGASVGGLVALTLSDLGEVVALDPPLSPADLWPIERLFSGMARTGRLNDAARDMVSRIFGYGGEAPKPTYHHIFDGLARPVMVLAGGVPLDPPRPLEALPGLVTEDDEAFLRAHALVGFERIADCGHDILKDRPDRVVAAIRCAMIRAGSLANSLFVYVVVF